MNTGHVLVLTGFSHFWARFVLKRQRRQSAALQGTDMKRVIAACALVVICGAASLDGCATMPLNGWSPSLQQIKSADALKPGVATLADVEKIYGVQCVSEARMVGDEACVIAVNPGYSTMLMYNMASDWSPSCWEDSAGCQNVSQVTSSTLTYIFDARDVLKTMKYDSSCTAYVAEYSFKNGCLDHD
jgi:hypothetical protein